jgi:hypothetical protein
MRIALFYPKNLYASWYALGGYKLALERLGHEVVDLPFPGNEVANIEVFRAIFPTIETLNGCDVILSMFHEYVQPWLEAIYGATWKTLTTPVIARFDESMDRADLQLPKRVPELLAWADYYSFPAAQDAERWHGQWLPFAGDTSMFQPTATEKEYEIGFVGSMYPVRLKYLEKLAEHLPNDLTFVSGPCIVQDLGGVNTLESTRLLAENYRKVKIFFCLPPMSRLLVCKVFEVMASGTFLMYPTLPGDAMANTTIFESGKHLVYYQGGHLKKNAAQILHYLENDSEREAIAKAGCDKVHSEHTLDQMLEKLLSLVLSPPAAVVQFCALPPAKENPHMPEELHKGLHLVAQGE